MIDWHDMSGWDWAWMAGMMMFWIAIVVGVVVAAVALLRHDRTKQPTPLEDLDRRLASGEIDVDEYERRRNVMRPSTA